MLFLVNGVLTALLTSTGAEVTRFVRAQILAATVTLALRREVVHRWAKDRLVGQDRDHDVYWPCCVMADD